MVQTRAVPAAGRGRGRPPLGRGRGRVPAVVSHAAEEIREEVAESVAPEVGNSAAQRQRAPRAQSADSGRVSMGRSEYQAHIRQVEEAIRAGRRAPDLPAQGGSPERSHAVT